MGSHQTYPRGTKSDSRLERLFWFNYPFYSQHCLLFDIMQMLYLGLPTLSINHFYIGLATGEKLRPNLKLFFTALCKFWCRIGNRKEGKENFCKGFTTASLIKKNPYFLFCTEDKGIDILTMIFIKIWHKIYSVPTI